LFVPNPANLAPEDLIYWNSAALVQETSMASNSKVLNSNKKFNNENQDEEHLFRGIS
jgi:hypothetical protein